MQIYTHAVGGSWGGTVPKVDHVINYDKRPVLYIKAFYDVAIFIICCRREACVSIVLNTE